MTFLRMVRSSSVRVKVHRALEHTKRFDGQKKQVFPRWETCRGGLFNSSASGVSADGSVIVGKGASDESPSVAFRWTLQTGMIALGALGADLPGQMTFSRANAVSADGLVVVGWSTSVEGGQAFRWTQDEGMEGLGDLPGGAFGSEAYAVSADGSVVVGASIVETVVDDTPHIPESQAMAGQSMRHSYGIRRTACALCEPSW